ncbi:MULTISPECIES: hypothetical protein [Paraburkholderia]|uniref:Tetratricopeptide repeat protein n=1 Tax=Paraburkholderia acidicola TaxID=1912599 RepID=A0ABV1LLM4_9BURK|nr:MULTISPECIES: hypothetical protein [Paraburkholderia]MCX4166150.1 hypothetical protein [Paraburkholderia megapolitana]MDN7161640.1 hypothetical protein [Paraburkholderia sp. CHISQ3]MDQ6498688.1 hypothetical protein [Paraburkholderia megapolitana]
MQFALLVSQLPRIHEARTHYNDMLSLEPRRRSLRASAAAAFNAVRAALKVRRR